MARSRQNYQHDRAQAEDFAKLTEDRVFQNESIRLLKRQWSKYHEYVNSGPSTSIAT